MMQTRMKTLNSYIRGILQILILQVRNLSYVLLSCEQNIETCDSIRY